MRINGAARRGDVAIDDEFRSAYLLGGAIYSDNGPLRLSLDLAYQLEVRSILLQLNRQRNLTIIISTHDLNLAAGLCRDLILLDRGHVLAAGPAERMLQPALIEQLYGVEVDIAVHSRTGRLTVVPVARGVQPPPS